jgi:hypothetical protein
VFIGVGLKGAVLRNVDFSHSTFVRCYFRNAELRGCNLTGCRFIDSEFANARLINCNLAYSVWRDTEIAPAQVLSNLPEWPNVAHKLLDSLRTNAISLGDGPAARRYLLRGMKYSREHYRRIAFSTASYYRDKYRGGRRVAGLLRWLFSVAERSLWAYGESPVLLLFWAAVVIGGFSVYYAVEQPTAFGFGSVPLSAAVRSALQYSALTFATNTPMRPMVSDILTFEGALVLESLCGVIFTGVLAAVMYRRISIRQGR